MNLAVCCSRTKEPSWKAVRARRHISGPPVHISSGFMNSPAYITRSVDAQVDEARHALHKVSCSAMIVRNCPPTGTWFSNLTNYRVSKLLEASWSTEQLPRCLKLADHIPCKHEKIACQSRRSLPQMESSQIVSVHCNKKQPQSSSVEPVRINDLRSSTTFTRSTVLKASDVQGRNASLTRRIRVYFRYIKVDARVALGDCALVISADAGTMRLPLLATMKLDLLRKTSRLSCGKKNVAFQIEKNANMWVSSMRSVLRIASTRFRLCYEDLELLQLGLKFQEVTNGAVVVVAVESDSSNAAAAAGVALGSRLVELSTDWGSMKVSFPTLKQLQMMLALVVLHLELVFDKRTAKPSKQNNVRKVEDAILPTVKSEILSLDTIIGADTHRRKYDKNYRSHATFRCLHDDSKVRVSLRRFHRIAYWLHPANSPNHYQRDEASSIHSAIQSGSFLCRLFEILKPNSSFGFARRPLCSEPMTRLTGVVNLRLAICTILHFGKNAKMSEYALAEELYNGKNLASTLDRIFRVYLLNDQNDARSVNTIVKWYDHVLGSQTCSAREQCNLDPWDIYQDGQRLSQLLSRFIQLTPMPFTTCSTHALLDFSFLLLRELGVPLFWRTSDGFAHFPDRSFFLLQLKALYERLLGCNCHAFALPKHTQSERVSGFLCRRIRAMIVLPPMLPDGSTPKWDSTVPALGCRSESCLQLYPFSTMAWIRVWCAEIENHQRQVWTAMIFRTSRLQGTTRNRPSKCTRQVVSNGGLQYPSEYFNFRRSAGDSQSLQSCLSQYGYIYKKYIKKSDVPDSRRKLSLMHPLTFEDLPALDYYKFWLTFPRIMSVVERNSDQSFFFSVKYARDLSIKCGHPNVSALAWWSVLPIDLNCPSGFIYLNEITAIRIPRKNSDVHSVDFQFNLVEISAMASTSHSIASASGRRVLLLRGKDCV